jgi:alkylation response protein AidB-like acyl-CoA dehydrogenase
MSQTAGMPADMREMVIATLRDVVARELPDATLIDLDAKDVFPLDLIRKMLSPELGLHLVFLPEETGGLGGGARDICVVSEEMARADLGLATAFLGICLGTDPILVGATPEQKDLWLGRIAEEGLIVAYAVTEPEAGSNLASLRTTATPILDEAGDIRAYRLDGAKQFITNGGVADLYTVLARTPNGPSFFVVERGTPGISPGKKEEKHGIRLSNTTSVLLEGAEVPASHLLGGKEGEGLKQANMVFGYTRLMVGALGLGGGQSALDRALAYAKVRVQFGSALIEKQGYAFKLLIPHWIDLAAGRAYIREIADILDGGQEGMQVEGSIAKLWATEAANRAADAAIQAHGGYGYTREYMVEKIRRDARILTIYEGTSEIQQQIISMFRWKETVRSKGGFYESQAQRLDGLHGERNSVGADLAAAALRGLNKILQHCHKSRLTRHQAVMFALADQISRCEVAAAFCRHAACHIREEREGATVTAAMARVFARDAARFVRSQAAVCCTDFVDKSNADAVKAATEVAKDVEESLQLAASTASLEDLKSVWEMLAAID